MWRDGWYSADEGHHLVSITTQAALNRESVSTMSAVLSVRNLCVTFPSPDGPLAAVRNISFDIPAGSVTAIAGESGAGKSVCADAILGLLPPNASVSGDILLNGMDLLSLDEGTMNTIRGRKVSRVFQDPMASLDPVIPIGKQMREAIVIHDKSLRKGWKEQAGDSLTLVDIGDPQRVLRSYPHELSGGMLQRVMIAMAITHRPPLLIADEPTTALDVTIQAQIIRLLRSVQEETGTAIMFITHDLGVVAGLASSTVVMYAGQIVEMGPTRSLFYGTRHPYTSGLLASTPDVRGDRRRRLVAIQGRPPDPTSIGPGCAFAARCRYRELVCQEQEPDLELLDGNENHRSRCHFKDDDSLDLGQQVRE